MHQKTVMDNGLRVVTETMPHTRSVSLGFYIGTGSRYETKKQAGISHYIEHVCFKGTKKRPTSIDICTEIEGVGGIINAGTDKELTVFWCKVARPHFERAYDVLADILLNSSFDPAEIEKERQVIIEEINMSLDSPAQRVSLLIDELLWPGHALGRDIAGTKKSVLALDRQMMLDYIAGQYRPDNVVLSVAGNVRHDEVVGLVAGSVEGWDKNKPAVVFKPWKDKIERRVVVEKHETEQAHLCLALPGISINNPDRFKLDLLNVILGEGMSSRLFTEIRDKLGLAYSIQSYSEHFLDTGALTVSAGVDPKNLPVAVRAILHELTRLREPIPGPELTKAKEMFKGRVLLRMEDSRNVSGWMAGQEILTGKIIAVDDVMGIIDGITADELKNMAEKVLVEEKLRLAVVISDYPKDDLEALLKL